MVVYCLDRSRWHRIDASFVYLIFRDGIRVACVLRSVTGIKLLPYPLAEEAALDLEGPIGNSAPVGDSVQFSFVAFFTYAS